MVVWTSLPHTDAAALQAPLRLRMDSTVVVMSQLIDSYLNLVYYRHTETNYIVFTVVTLQCVHIMDLSIS